VFVIDRFEIIESDLVVKVIKDGVDLQADAEGLRSSSS